MSQGDIQLFDKDKNEFSDLGGSDDQDQLSINPSPQVENNSSPLEQQETNGLTHNVINTKLEKGKDLTESKISKNNFMKNNKQVGVDSDEQPISTMKQDDPNKYVKEQPPKCDIDPTDKISNPSQRQIGNSENITGSQRNIGKPRRRSTIRESAVNEMKSFEIFKKFEDDENIKNEKLNQF